MTTFANSMQTTAKRLIGRFGADIVYTFVTVNAYDPATGGAALTNFDFPLKAVVGPAGRELVNGSWIERDGLRLTIAAEGLPAYPAPNDRVAFNGLSYLVERVAPVYAASLVASYDLTVKKA
jgi:hypothetical protein